MIQEIPEAGKQNLLMALAVVVMYFNTKNIDKYSRTKTEIFFKKIIKKIANDEF